jgi:hypothetical protein
LRTERDVELLLKLPILALIPEVEIIKGSRTNGFGSDNLKPSTETVKMGIGV